jgi:hypothetical protein
MILKPLYFSSKSEENQDNEPLIRFCQICGKIAEDNDIFCYNCGKKEFNLNEQF